jgi:2-C-methyl-D-erythritol 2,4-cyclodiphosphate synthase
VGHSDADVLLHAVTDALLGAAALGDIGELFPDTELANRGRDSAEMLLEASRKVAAAGYRMVNVDCIVFAERPRLSPHKRALQQRLAELLAIDPEAVGVKAKTGEGIGEIGREEVVMAQSVVLLEKTDLPKRLGTAENQSTKTAQSPGMKLVGGIVAGAILAMWGTQLFVQGWTLRGDGPGWGALAVRGAYCLGGLLVGLAGAFLGLSSAMVLSRKQV